MRTFKLTVTEDELKAIIRHHTNHMAIDGYKVDTSARIHDLTKRLNKRNDDADNTDVERENATEQPKVEGWN
mgnify:CR=1 FL=1